MRFFAHSIAGHPPDEWQPLLDHLTATAAIAEGFGAAFGSGYWAYLCGLLHDIGKYSQEFQKRLRGGKRVDHSLAGALEVIRFIEGDSRGAFSRLLASIISGHHTGLVDGEDLTARLKAKNTIPDYSAWAKELSLPQGLASYPVFPWCKDADVAFSVCFWVRMVYSCLVDADFLDTESVMAPEKSAQRGGYPDLACLHKAFTAYMAQKSAEAAPGKVNTQRAKVLAACREAALLEQGLFSLTVPTGGGKTLSSLAFALSHAARHSLRRIIYVIPYTSIIEQTADVFRKAFGPELAHAVIEHHFNAVEKLEKLPADADEREDLRSLAFENWDAPIIVTTAVQFFESLYAARSSRCRKLHNIAGSVVILDEAQTLPTRLFRPCLAAIRELTGLYRTSVVLCTATQPEVGVKPWNRNGLEGVREIAPDPPALFRSFERVKVEHLGHLDMPALARRFSGHERALCILNTRKQTREFCEMLRGTLPEGQALFHLSTWMCPAHRRAVLAQIKALLLDPARPPLLVVSTSLVEAGVDLDFPFVYRAMTGVDSIAQAAGRNNREGLLDWGYTYVFSLPGALLGEQDRRRGATEEVLRQGLPLLSQEAVKLYFDELHSMQGPNGLDQPGILRRVRENAKKGLFPFRSLEHDFRFIDDYELPVIIPYNADARAALEALRAGRADRSLYRRLQQWSVGLPQKALLAELGKSIAAVGFAGQHYELINTDLYDGLDDGQGDDQNGRHDEKTKKQTPAHGLDMRNPTFRTVEGSLF